MTKLVRTPTVQTAQPLDLFGRLRNQMDDLFTNFFDELPTARMPAVFGGTDFAVDVAETDKVVTVKADLPGVEPDDVTVTLEGAALMIEAEKKVEKEEKEKDWYRVERSYGSLKRVIPLGFEPEAEKMEARLDKGVLTIKVPRPMVETPKARKVEVKAA